MRFAVLFLLISMLSKGASAAFVDPFYKRVLAPVDGSKFSAGLCPGGAPGKFERTKTIRVSVLQENIRRDLRMQSALSAAGAIYRLPDLETARSGRELLERTVEFMSKVPDGYSFYADFSESETGLKYMILEPTKFGEPWILAIAGTSGLLDIAVDAGFGQAQLQKFVRATNVLTTCQYFDRLGLPLAAHSWIITGHSLGGGLAQAFAYEVQLERRAKNLNPLAMHVISFNGFGARELIAKTQAYDSSLEAFLNARNYFVAGDPISRIGHHVGPTFQITPSTGAERALTPNELLRRHSLETIDQAVKAQSLALSPLSTAAAASPPTSAVLTTIARLKHITRIFPKAVSLFSADHAGRVLEEATQQQTALDSSIPEQRATLVYLGMLRIAHSR